MIHVRLLGQVAVTVGDVALSGEAAQRRRIALLALLCVPPLRSISRDRLLLYLWPDNGSESARHLLSVALHALRGSLGHDALVAGRDDVAVDASHFQVDVIDFETALEREDHEGAVAIYGGPFMDGFHAGPLPEFDEWLEGERARLQGLYGAALESVAATRAAAGDHLRAVEAWKRLAALDPYSSRAALGLMRALAAAGNRAGAIRHAGVHRQLLEAELGSGPDPEVEELAEALRQETVHPAPAAEAHTEISATAVVLAASGQGSQAETSTAPPAEGEIAVGAHPPPDAAGLAASPATETAAMAAPVRPAPESIATAADYSRKLRRVRALTAASLVLGSVGVLSGAGAIVWHVWDRLELAPYVGAEPAVVAVLPFRDVTPEGGAGLLGSQMAERVHDELHGAGIRVVSSMSSTATQARNLMPQELARLGVTWIVDGNVALTSGDSMYVSVELVSTRGAALPLWRDKYERPRQSTIDVSQAIARRVAHSLGR